MPTKTKLVLAGAVVGILLVAVMLVRLASAPSYTTLRTGLDPAETGKITQSLDEAGIRYELQNNGTALAVEKSKTAQAQVALAEGGLGSGSGRQPGYELLKDQKLGASDFQQRVTYQRALEGELSRTIDQVDGVNGAEVQLTLPDDQLFADENKAATAAVLLGGETQLDPQSIKGIANLVASSVEGLKTENVTISDATGRMVWPTGDAGGAGTSAASKTAAEAKYANELESSLNALLLRTVGPGKAQVKVKADLDVDQVKEKALRYARRGTPIEEVKETERLRGAGGAGGAGAGTRANIPTYQAAGGAAGAGSNYNKRSTKRTQVVGKTITDTVKAPGTVKRLDVALVLDRSLAGQRTEIEKAVAGAAGVQQQRGDTMTVSQLAFAPATVPKASGPVPAGTINIAKYVGIALASLLFLLFVGRHLRKREDEAFMGEPLWLRQIEAPTPLSALEAAGAAAKPATPSRATSRQTVEDAVRMEPERVAQQVRSWLSEDRR
jgi:flagellar M-ring protein FliF